MRKFYYVCPRCGRCYKRYIPRRSVKCAFCSTVWKTRRAKGTRSAFSLTATLVLALAIGALAYGIYSGAFAKFLGDKAPVNGVVETPVENGTDANVVEAPVENGTDANVVETPSDDASATAE